MEDDNNIISNEDIDMLNVDDLNQFNRQELSTKSIPHSAMNLDSNGDSVDIDHDENDEDDDENFLTETDTKTPGEILDEFCCKLNDINTTLPENVINYYMKKTGFIVNDPKLIKLISIASQKFISEIVNDVMQHHKLRTKASSSSMGAASSSTGPVTSSSITNATTAGTSTSSSSTTAAFGANSVNQTANINSKSNKANNLSSGGLTLTLEDLTQVLTEYGINVKKPYYFM